MALLTNDQIEMQNASHDGTGVVVPTYVPTVFCANASRVPCTADEETSADSVEIADKA